MLVELAQLESELFLLTRVLEAYLLIVQQEEVYRYHCHCYLVQSIEEIIIYLEATETILKIEVEENQSKSSTLVDIQLSVDNKVNSELSPVPEEESPQVLESGNGIVSVAGSLISFFSEDSDPNVGGLYHIYIVRTVSNAQSDGLFLVFLDKLNYFGLLRGRKAVGDCGTGLV